MREEHGLRVAVRARGRQQQVFVKALSTGTQIDLLGESCGSRATLDVRWVSPEVLDSRPLNERLEEAQRTYRSLREAVAEAEFQLARPGLQPADLSYWKRTLQQAQSELESALETYWVLNVQRDPVDRESRKAAQRENWVQHGARARISRLIQSAAAGPSRSFKRAPRAPSPTREAPLPVAKAATNASQEAREKRKRKRAEEPGVSSSEPPGPPLLWRVLSY
eukprot:1963227-Rhodomonas_salina.1